MTTYALAALVNGHQFFSQSGALLSGGKINTYFAGTTTPAATYTDSTGATPNANPIIIGSDGRPASAGVPIEVWIPIATPYKFQVTDSFGVVQSIYDNIPAINDTTITNALLTTPTINGATINGPTSLTGTTTNTGTISGGTITGANVLSNTRLAKTANYTVSNADKGATLALGGNALFTVTFSTISGGNYDSNFIILVLNEDVYSSSGAGNQGRAKFIALPGNTFRLWPGQSVIVFNDSGTWRTTPRSDSGANEQRWRAPGPINLYVDPISGSDASGDGMNTGSGAFATIGFAAKVIYQQIDCITAHSIIPAAGTYTESVTLQGQISGFNFFYITGPGSANMTWKPNGGACLLVGDGAEVILSGIKFDNTAGTNGLGAIQMHQTAIIDLNSDLNYGNFPGGTHISADGSSNIGINNAYAISGSATWHVNLGPLTRLAHAGGANVTISNTPTFSVFIRGGPMISYVYNATTTYTGAITVGCQQYSIDGLSNIALAGTTIPGSVAGSAGHGSQVY
jgi:hypothetical protein